MKMIEAIELIKFKYTNAKNDKKPRVVVLDKNYKKSGESINRNDLLGFNINYSKDKKYALTSIKDILGFADLLDEKNKRKRYERIRDFFPEQRDLIRRYNKRHIKSVKVKTGRKWKRGKV